MEYKISNKDKERIIREFSELYYYSSFDGGTWRNTFWMGTPIQKYPTDMWIYQEIIFKNKINFIIETGTYMGGSALYLANLLEIMGDGMVISIDIDSRSEWPKHSRLNYINGSSTDMDTVKKVTSMIRASDRLLIILDSDHHKDHVLQELNLYSSLVQVGGYLIVEDTNLNGHPITTRRYGALGPMEAVEEFLKYNPKFVIDSGMEKLYLTTNPRGYLKRIF